MERMSNKLKQRKVRDYESKQSDIYDYTLAEILDDSPTNYEISVLIPSRLCDWELEELANHIYKREGLGRKRFSYIYFHVTEYNSELEPWAEAGFDPSLYTDIMGIDANDFSQLGLRQNRKGAHQPKIIGEWINDDIPGTISIVEIDGEYYYRELDLDIEEYDDYLIEYRDGKYFDPDYEFDYYRIDSVGNLIVSEDGYRRTRFMPLSKGLQTHRYPDCY